MEEAVREEDGIRVEICVMIQEDRFLRKRNSTHWGSATRKSLAHSGWGSPLFPSLLTPVTRASSVMICLPISSRD